MFRQRAVLSRNPAACSRQSGECHAKCTSINGDRYFPTVPELVFLCWRPMSTGRPKPWNCNHSDRLTNAEQGAARRADANEPGYCGAEGRSCLPQAKARFAVVLSCLHREIA